VQRTNLGKELEDVRRRFRQMMQPNLDEERNRLGCRQTLGWIDVDRTSFTGRERTDELHSHLSRFAGSNPEDRSFQRIRVVFDIPANECVGDGLPDLGRIGTGDLGRHIHSKLGSGSGRDCRR
jgi:hypothetical protein